MIAKPLDLLRWLLDRIAPQEAKQAHSVTPARITFHSITIHDRTRTDDHGREGT
jgi:hypothetical protein